VRKIVIIGCCGGGKTTLAYQLSRKLSIEVYDLDDHFWHAGWVVTPDDRWQEIQHELVGRDSWIISGTYTSTLDIRINAADTIIFLDLPLWLCFWRVIKRKVKNYYGLEQSLPKRVQGSHKFGFKAIRSDLGFLLYVLKFKKNYNAPIRKILDRVKADKKVIKLSSPKEVTEFVADVIR
jgi:adenylate kinase family enzyme